MSSSTRELREDLLHCAICLREFKEPKSLPCLHTFCAECLDEHVISSISGRGSNSSFTCPTCRDVIKIPSAGTAAFRSDVKIHKVAALLERVHWDSVDKSCYVCKNEKKKMTTALYYCCDCCFGFCHSCQEKHNGNKLFSGHNIKPITDSVVTFCTIHSNCVNQYHCETCNADICSMCILGTHKDHDVIDADSKHKFSKWMKRIEKRKDELRRRISNVQKQHNDLELKVEPLKSEIDDHVSHVLKDIRSKADALKSRINNYITKSAKHAETIGEELRDRLDKLQDLEVRIATLQSRQYDCLESRETSSEDKLGDVLESILTETKLEAAVTLPVTRFPRFVPGEGEVYFGDISGFETPSQQEDCKKTDFNKTHCCQHQRSHHKNKFAHFMKRLYSGKDYPSHDESKTTRTPPRTPLCELTPTRNTRDNLPTCDRQSPKAGKTSSGRREICEDCHGWTCASTPNVSPSAPPLALIDENTYTGTAVDSTPTRAGDSKSNASLRRTSSVPTGGGGGSMRQTQRSLSASSCPQSAPLNLRRRSSERSSFCEVMLRELLTASGQAAGDDSCFGYNRSNRPKYMEDSFR